MPTSSLNDIKLFYKLPNNNVISVIINDTAGQERYRSLGRNYYNKADGILLIFDITNKKTFQELTNYYLDEIKNSCKKNVALILLGNKLDLEEKREVSSKEALSFALKNRYLYFETSCKNNINSIESFELLIENCYNEALNNKNIIVKNNNSKFRSYDLYIRENNKNLKDTFYNNNLINNLEDNYNNYINNKKNNLGDNKYNLGNLNSLNNNNNEKDKKFSLSLTDQKNRQKKVQKSSSCC